METKGFLGLSQNFGGCLFEFDRVEIFQDASSPETLQFVL